MTTNTTINITQEKRRKNKHEKKTMADPNYDKENNNKHTILGRPPQKTHAPTLQHKKKHGPVKTKKPKKKHNAQHKIKITYTIERTRTLVVKGTKFTRP